MLDKQLLCLVYLRLVRSVEGIAESLKRDKEGVADAVRHNNLSGILLIEEHLPALRVLLGDHLGVVDNADGAPEMRDGILVFGIE